MTSPLLTSSPSDYFTRLDYFLFKDDKLRLGDGIRNDIRRFDREDIRNDIRDDVRRFGDDLRNDDMRRFGDDRIKNDLRRFGDDRIKNDVRRFGDDVRKDDRRDDMRRFGDDRIKNDLRGFGDDIGKDDRRDDVRRFGDDVRNDVRNDVRKDDRRECLKREFSRVKKAACSDFDKKLSTDYDKKLSSDYDKKQSSDFERKLSSDYDKKQSSDFERKLLSDFDKKQLSDFDKKLSSDFDKKLSSDFDRKQLSDFDKKLSSDFDKKQAGEIRRDLNREKEGETRDSIQSDIRSFDLDREKKGDASSRDLIQGETRDLIQCETRSFDLNPEKQCETRRFNLDREKKCEIRCGESIQSDISSFNLNREKQCEIRCGESIQSDIRSFDLDREKQCEIKSGDSIQCETGDSKQGETRDLNREPIQRQLTLPSLDCKRESLIQLAGLTPKREFSGEKFSRECLKKQTTLPSLPSLARMPLRINYKFQIEALNNVNLISGPISFPHDSLIIDLRPFPEFSASHCKNAVNICLPSTLLKRSTFTLQRCIDSLPILEKEKLTTFFSSSSSKSIYIYDSLNYSQNLYHFLLKLISHTSNKDRLKYADSHEVKIGQDVDKSVNSYKSGENGIIKNMSLISPSISTVSLDSLNGDYFGTSVAPVESLEGCYFSNNGLTSVPVKLPEGCYFSSNNGSSVNSGSITGSFFDSPLNTLPNRPNLNNFSSHNGVLTETLNNISNFNTTSTQTHNESFSTHLKPKNDNSHLNTIKSDPSTNFTNSNYNFNIFGFNEVTTELVTKLSTDSTSSINNMPPINMEKCRSISAPHLPSSTPILSNFVLPPKVSCFKIRHNEELINSHQNIFNLTLPNQFSKPTWLNIDDLSKSFQQLELLEQSRLMLALTSKNDLTISSGIEFGHKNRYKDIFLFEQTRVKLNDLNDEHDYINASYVNLDFLGISNELHYIATQGPLNQTMGDFWLLAFEQCSLIISLTEEVENGMIKCSNFWKSGIYKSSKNLIFNVVVVDSYEVGGIIVRLIAVTHEDVTRHLLQCQLINWPDMTVCLNPQDLLHLIQLKLTLFNKIDSKQNYPTVVHCSAGCGRTGTFCAIDTVINSLLQKLNLQENSIFDIVNNFRNQRISMVQNLRQYYQIHQVVIDYLSTVTEFEDKLTNLDILKKFIDLKQSEM